LEEDIIFIDIFVGLKNTNKSLQQGCVSQVFWNRVERVRVGEEEVVEWQQLQTPLKLLAANCDKM